MRAPPYRPYPDQDQRAGAGAQPLERAHGTGHAHAIANTALAVHFDFKNAFAGIVVRHDFHVTEFQMLDLVGTQPRGSHEEHKVMQLLGMPFLARIFRLIGVRARRLIELFVFVGREPWAASPRATP